MPIFSFEQAIARIPANTTKHLLIGNGFSQSWRADVFSYGSLLAQADFARLDPLARRCFDSLETTDFEAVIKALKDASTLLRIYDPQNALCETMTAHSSALKNLLIDTITANHPDSPAHIEELQYRSCRRFLRSFKNIYTLNYDLLLYWSLLHDCEGETPAEVIESDDGFRHPDGEEETDYVTWEIEKTNKQNINYLHGALHIYEDGPELLKFTWSRTGLSLLKQIRDALNSNRYPLIVAEGTSEQKMARIMQSGYLLRSLKSLASIGGALVIYGFAFSENDAHVIKRIAKGKVRRLVVGLYGDPASEGNRMIAAKVHQIIESRPTSNPLTVDYFDSTSAAVWGA